jgi:hypothetical protein
MGCIIAGMFGVSDAIAEDDVCYTSYEPITREAWAVDVNCQLSLGGDQGINANFGMEGADNPTALIAFAIIGVVIISSVAIVYKKTH